MAWPSTTRDTDFTELQMVEPAFLNELQDRLIDLYGGHERVEQVAIVQTDTGSGEAGWHIDPGDVQFGHKCRVDNNVLAILIRSRNGLVLTGLTAKVRAEAGSNLTATLYLCDLEFTSAATAPTKTQLANDAVSGDGWQLLSLNPEVEVTVGAGQVLMLAITLAATDDNVAGVKVDARPLTASS